MIVTSYLFILNRSSNKEPGHVSAFILISTVYETMDSATITKVTDCEQGQVKIHSFFSQY